MFHTFVFSYLYVLCLAGASGVKISETSTISVTEGDSVTLHTDVNELQRDDVIVWTFGDQDTHIAKINRERNDNRADGRFGDRLKVDLRTGSLTITDTRPEHAGLYKIEIVTENKVSRKDFIVQVYALLPLPVITRHCLQNPSSPSSCSLLCSVFNVSHVTLSWLKGNSLLSSISVSDLNSSVSLNLDVEDQDENSYSCEINNPINNKTQHLNINELCQKNSNYVHYYGFTEAVMRLALSALMGVAVVAVLVYEVRTRLA